MLYDEEILAGLSPDESDMTTKCAFCTQRIVPGLTVRFRHRQPECEKQVNRFDHAGLLPGSRKRSGSLDSLPLAMSKPAIGSHRLFDSPESASVPASPEHASHGSIFRARAKDDGVSKGPRGHSSRMSEFRSRTLSNDHVSVAAASSPAELMKFKVRRKLDFELTHASAPVVRLQDQFQSSSESCLLSPLRENAEGHHPLAEEPVSDKVETSREESFELSYMFLGPLFLRKELEDALEQTGFEHLARESFAKQHDTLFWNMMYYFTRLAVPSHMHSWLPVAFAAALDRIPDHLRAWASPDVVAGMGPSDFVLRVVYDNPDIYVSDVVAATCSSHKPPSACTPLHTRPNDALHAEVEAQLGASNLLKPVQALLNHYRKQAVGLGASPSRSLPRHVSIYRDVLFVALTSFPGSIDHDAFDREFARALARLPPMINTLMAPSDKPPGPAIRATRKVFMPIHVV